MTKQIDTEKSYHQIVVKSPFATNTGPVKMFVKDHYVKWGFAEEYIKRNPNLEVVKVLDHVTYK